MNFISVICLLFLYLWIKPPETFNVNKTDGTLSYFKEEFEMNWQKERNILIFLILHQTRWKSNWVKLKRRQFINDFVVKLDSVVTKMLQRLRTL